MQEGLTPRSIPRALSNNRALRERSKDTALAAVLMGKPVERIPIAAWWFVADSLRSSVEVRRSVLGIAVLTHAEFYAELERAKECARAAMEEISDEQWSGTPLLAGSIADCGRPAATLRVTIHELARLIVTPRETTPVRLGGSLCTHLQALSRCDMPHTSG
jgi:hypothetical protein